MPGRRSYERSNSNGEDDYADDFENPSDDDSPIKASSSLSPTHSKTNQNGLHLKSSTQSESIHDSGHCRIIESNNNNPSRRGSNHSTSSGRPKSKRRSALWIQEGKWSLGECIGKGSFGDVFQCMNDKGKLYASKRVEISSGCRKEELDDMVKEIEFMRDLCHPNIVEYIGATVDENRGHLYIFQEWVSGGSLAHLLKRFGPFQEGVVQNYTRQVLFGLDYLHRHHIVHRDIKGGNILVDESGTVKLADFGASTKLIQAANGDDASFYQTQELLEIKGTSYFMAPEVLSENKYGRKGDIWAVGCTMFQMLTGEPPWKDQNLAGLVQLHVLLQSWPGGPPPMPGGRGDTLSADLKKCLNMCFQKSVHDRPTPEKLLECDFFASLNNDNLDESSTYEAYGGSPDEKSYAMNSNNNNSNYNRPGSSSSGSGNNGSGLGREYLEDSGVISGLRAKMERVMSTALLPPSSVNNNNNNGNGNNNNVYSNQSSPEHQMQRKSPNLFHPTPSPVFAAQQQHVGMINIRRSHNDQPQQSSSNDIRKTSPEQQQQQQQYNLHRVPSDTSNSPPSQPSTNNTVNTNNTRVKNPFSRSREGQPACSPTKGIPLSETTQQNNSSNNNAIMTPSSAASLRSFSTDTAAEKEQAVVGNRRQPDYDRVESKAIPSSSSSSSSSRNVQVNNNNNNNNNNNINYESSMKSLSQRERLQQHQFNSNQINIIPVTNNNTNNNNKNSSNTTTSPRSDLLQSYTDQRQLQQQQASTSTSRTTGGRRGLASHAILSNDRINSDRINSANNMYNDNDSGYEEKTNSGGNNSSSSSNRMRDSNFNNNDSSSRTNSGGSIRINSGGSQSQNQYSNQNSNQQSRLLPPHAFDDEFNSNNNDISPRSIGCGGSVTDSSSAHTTPAADSFRVITTHTPIGSLVFMNADNNNNNKTNSNNHSNRFFATTDEEAAIIENNSYKNNNNINSNYSFNHGSSSSVADRPLQTSQRSSQNHHPPATAPESSSSTSTAQSNSRISRQQQQQQQQSSSSSSLLSSSVRLNQQKQSYNNSNSNTNTNITGAGSVIKQRPSQLRDSRSSNHLNTNTNNTIKPSTANAAITSSSGSTNFNSNNTSSRISGSRRPIANSTSSSSRQAPPQQAWGSSSSSNTTGMTDGNNGEEWKCLKCNRSNSVSLHYCDGCATIRGATGRRDNTAGLHRL